MAGQRLRDLNLDFSGFSRAAGRTVDAARIEAEGTAALGANIRSGVDAISSGITRRRGEQRADALRGEENARLDAREAKADARYNEERAYRAEQDQYRRDAQNWEIIDARLKALGAQADDAVTIGDASRATEIMAEINKYNALKHGIEGRLMGGQRGMDASMQSFADRDPESADAAMDRLGYDNRPGVGAPITDTQGRMRGRLAPDGSMPPMPQPTAPGPRAKAGPSSIDLATTAAVDNAFAGGPGFFPKRATLPGYETSTVPAATAAPADPIAEGLARAAALREQNKQLNQRGIEAAKRGDRVTAGKFFDRATLAVADAAREEAAVKAATAKAEADQKARDAAATLAQKRAEADEKQKAADLAATAEYAAESGQPWTGPPMTEAEAKGRLSRFRDDRERTQADARTADARAREDAIRADERARADAKTVAGEVREAGKEARDVTEKEATDAEQDFNAALRVYLSLVPFDTAEKDAATKDAKAAMLAAKKQMDEMRSRRRGGAPAPAAAPPPAAGPATAPASRIRDWAAGR